jgi:hypothetical protein
MNQPMQLGKTIITLDTIGQAYIAEHEAAKALEIATRKLDAGRISVEQYRKTEATATAARRTRQTVVAQFVAGAHTSSVTVYEGDAAA